MTRITPVTMMPRIELFAIWLAYVAPVIPESRSRWAPAYVM